MSITWSAKGIAKAVGVFILLSAVAGLVVSGAAAGVDAVAPGKGLGAHLKSILGR